MNIHGHLFDFSKTMPCIATTVILITDLCFLSMLPINEMSKLPDLHSKTNLPIMSLDFSISMKLLNYRAQPLKESLWTKLLFKACVTQAFSPLTNDTVQLQSVTQQKLLENNDQYSTNFFLKRWCRHCQFIGCLQTFRYLLTAPCIIEWPVHNQ